MDEAVHQCCQCHILSNLAIEESMLHGTAITASLVSAFVVMRLGYCNVVLAGLPASTIAPLRQVQNVAAWLIKGLGPRDLVTSALHSLHWLLIQKCIIYKLYVLMHQVLTDSCPAYMSNLVTATANISSQVWLISISIHRYEPLTTCLKFGQWCLLHVFDRYNINNKFCSWKNVTNKWTDNVCCR